MYSSKAAFGLVLSLVANVLPANGQFYAPDTEYHDQVQRTFVVELARVLAWRENLSDPKISEITFQVTNDAGHQTTWDLQWLGSDGKQVRQATVSYPSALLLEGPEFYRNVFRQLWASGWKPLPETDATNIEQLFWQAGETAGPSRMEGINRAFKLAPLKPTLPESEYAPRLAGVLVHTCLPSVAGSITLDTVVLARAAAWLSLSEAMIKSPQATNDVLWAPILFLAGREPAANALWTRNIKTPPPPDSAPLLFTWWDFLLRRPLQKEAFVFAVAPKYRSVAMPLLVYYSRANGADLLLPQLLSVYYPDREVLRLDDYGPYLALNSGVGGGRILEGGFPVLARADWLATFNNCPLGPFDYDSYLPLLQAALKESQQLQPDPQSDRDECLYGFSVAAPLIKLGLEQGVGKLTPTATVTSRDLLNYGWEMTGQQMGARYYFVNRVWGVPPRARAIYEDVTRQVPGLATFFFNEGQAGAYDLRPLLYRLQNVEGLLSKINVAMQPFSDDPKDRQAARIYARRCWLRPGDLQGQFWALRESGIQGDIAPIIRQGHEQSGLLYDVCTLNYLDSILRPGARSTPRLFALQEELARGLPEPSALQIRSLYAKVYAPMTNFERAQALEKLYWQNQESGADWRVYDDYVRAGAFKSAKRFYLQIRGNIREPIGFGREFADPCFMLAYLQGDQDLMKLALHDGDTGSDESMYMHLCDCAIRGDVDGMNRQADELIQRYESEAGTNSSGRRLQGFLPLIPALQDPTNPNHAAALDYWGQDQAMTLVRWILSRNCHLSAAETSRFLGGEESSPFHRVLILYARHDQAHIRDAWNEFLHSKVAAIRPAMALASYLTHDLAPEPLNGTETDLKPPGSVSILQAVEAELARNR